MDRALNKQTISDMKQTKQKETIKEIKIPADITAEVNGVDIVVTGKLGKIEKSFPQDRVSIEKKEDSIIISARQIRKKEKKIAGAIAAHIRNMILGVNEGFEYKLQVCSVHFPVSVSIDSSKKLLIVKNFLGESNERKAKILGNAEVKIQGDIITVKSIEKEIASQTAANMEMATRIRAKDRRVFQDGIFITEKAGKKI